MFDWPLSLSGTEKWFDMQDLDPKKRNFMIISKGFKSANWNNRANRH